MQVDFINDISFMAFMAFVSWNLNQDSSYIVAWSLDLCILSTIKAVGTTLTSSTTAKI